MSVWALYRRYALSQALLIVTGWASLHYAWGIEVQSWPVALVYLAVMSLGYPMLAAYSHKGGSK